MTEEITGPRAYVVMAEAGEYSQRDQWPESVSLEEQAAYEDVARLKVKATADFGDYHGSEKPIYTVIVVPLADRAEADPQLDLWISPSERYTDPIAAARLRVAVRRLRWMRTLARELVARADGEPHCHACVFCGSIERSQHAEECPWPKLVAEVRV
jgi:hypothetical protein